MFRRRVGISLVTAVVFGITGCMDTTETASSADPPTGEAGVFLVSGDATKILNCAFWNGAGQDAIMLTYDEGGSIIGPGGWTAKFEPAQGRKTRVQIRDKDDKADNALNAKMQSWLNGCP